MASDHFRIGESEPKAIQQLILDAARALRGWQAIPATIIALYIILGVAGPWIAPYDPHVQSLRDRYVPPLTSSTSQRLAIQDGQPVTRDETRFYVLGSDENGRDVFSKLLHGARTSFSVVGSSVLIGTIVGVAGGVWINGLRPRRRLIAYLIVGATIVPFGFFVINQPEILAYYRVIVTFEDFDKALRWSSITSFSCVTALIALALIAVAYQFDDRCLPNWSRRVDNKNGTSDSCSRFRQQLIELGPWIVLVVFASAGLIMPHSLSSTFQTSAVMWSFEHDYLFEHVGMFSPLVPMILLPIAFVSLGAWWVIHHLLCRFTTTSGPSPATVPNADDSSEEPLLNVAVPPERGSDQMGSKEPEIGVTRSFAGSVAIVKLRRWLPALVATFAVLMIALFGVYQAWPNVRFLLQDSSFSRESHSARYLQERAQALECASEVSSKLMTLRRLTPEERDLNSGQRCLDLYHQHRNAPTHHLTFDFTLRMVSQTLTLALIGTVIATALLVATLGTTTTVRRAVQFVVGLIALTGLTITFGPTVWLINVVHWLQPTVVIWSDRGLAIQGVLGIFRDFSVALGIGFVIAATTIAILRRDQIIPNFKAASSWTSYLLPSVCLTAGLMVVFHYPFPSLLLIIDNQLAVIADASEGQLYRSQSSLFQNWLWTYWFALIGYAAIVFACFATAIWGFRRFVSSDPNGADQTLVSPDNPSQAADPSVLNRPDQRFMVPASTRSNFLFVMPRRVIEAVYRAFLATQLRKILSPVA